MTRYRATAVLLGVVLLGACTAPEHGYTVTRRAQANGTGSVDLVLPGATRAQARQAIRDYAASIDGAELFYVKVVDGEGGGRYVCRGRWYRDAASYAEHGEGTGQPSSWPHLSVSCP
ncbi:hypothetical protein [Streptomyces chartreusis]|uniref:hypothetical protein n=1 Tax=Streptomyces chartreusis TaxID=1969 RepID=UPI00366613DC